MYSIEKLFDLRVVVGCKLEELINSRSYTKKEVCDKSGISRPTLDKLLAGEVTNKINFEKHMSKLLAFLSITPSELIGGIDNPYNQARNLREMLKINIENLSVRSGVPVEKLKKIESGENIPLADMRDVAIILGTNVSGLLGNNYFQTTVNCLSYLVKEDCKTIRSVGGFWGHFGVLLQGQSKYLWFPITAFTRNLIYQNNDKEYMVIPCMDNSLLIINNKCVNEIVFLEDSCDKPIELDWNYNVSSGEIPPVIYEAFDDYYNYKDCESSLKYCNMSAEFAEVMDNFMIKNQIDLDEFDYRLNSLIVMYNDGTEKEHRFEYNDDCVCFSDIRCLYEVGNLFGTPILNFEDDNEMDVLINLQNVSMIKMPLAKTEEYICKDLDGDI